jgi:hypothetical protein
MGREVDLTRQSLAGNFRFADDTGVIARQIEEAI